MKRAALVLGLALIAAACSSSGRSLAGAPRAALAVPGDIGVLCGGAPLHADGSATSNVCDSSGTFIGTWAASGVYSPLASASTTTSSTSTTAPPTANVIDCHGQPYVGATGASISSLPNGTTVQNCVFQGGSNFSVSLTGGSGYTFTHDTFAKESTLDFTNVSGSTVTASTFTYSAPDVKAWGLGDYKGTNNSFTNNVMTGASVCPASYPGPCTVGGGDDGIVLRSVTGDTVTGNTISHFLDAEIELLGLNQNVTLSGNTLSFGHQHGGIYCELSCQLVGDSFSNNTMGPGNQFAFYVVNTNGVEATPGNYAPAAGAVAFTGNHFDNNQGAGPWFSASGFAASFFVMYDSQGTCPTCTYVTNANTYNGNAFPGTGQVLLLPKTGWLPPVGDNPTTNPNGVH
jgi:hypothetical protein